jgi:hypothetical protein
MPEPRGAPRQRPDCTRTLLAPSADAGLRGQAPESHGARSAQPVLDTQRGGLDGLRPTAVGGVCPGRCGVRRFGLLHAEDLGQLAVLVHLGDDVAAADELAVDEQRGIVGQFESALSSWRMRGSGRMSTAANGVPSPCSAATVRAEKPQAGWSGLPFMKRITGLSEIASAIASRIGLSVCWLMAPGS